MAATTLSLYDSPAEIGARLGGRLLQCIDRARQSGKRFVLGCPTGRTPRPIYDAMAARLATTPQDLSHLVLVMMDEYLVSVAGGFDYASAELPWSCHHFARSEIAARLNQSLPDASRLRDDSIWFPDPRDPGAYDAKIAGAGGIDFFVLASGASDGHVAFNPPGSARESRTRIIKLSDETRRDNLQTFPAFGTLDKVPTHGISAGIATIASAKEAAMVVWGKSKAPSLARILAAHRYESDWPATVIHECSVGVIIADAEAAAEQGKTLT